MALPGEGLDALAPVARQLEESVTKSREASAELIGALVEASELAAEDLNEANGGWSPRWFGISAAQGAGLRREFLNEIAPQRRHLRRVNDLLVIARYGGSDDVLGWVMEAGQPNGALAAVHLTWSQEHDPAWPGLTPYESARDFVSAQRSAASGSWPAQGGLQAIQFALGPATWTERPELNALLACSLGHSALPAFAVEEALAREVMPWVLDLHDPLAARLSADS